MLNNSSSSSINLTSIMFAKYPTTTIASQKVSWFQLCLGRWLSDESSQIVAPIFNTLNLIISKAIFWNYCIGNISFFFCYSDLRSNIFLLLWQKRCKYSCQTDQTYPLLISISQYYKLCLELRKIRQTSCLSGLVYKHQFVQGYQFRLAGAVDSNPAIAIGVWIFSHPSEGT